MPNLPTLPEEPVRQIEMAAEAALREDWYTMATCLKSLDQDVLKKLRAKLNLPPDREQKQRIIPKKDRHKAPKLEFQVPMFRRANFLCEYCRGKTVATPVLHLLSSICYNSLLNQPEVFPVAPHWSFSNTHLFYWVYTVSCEHKKPLLVGGDNDPSNLLTACYRCNDLKAERELGQGIGQLDWTSQEATPSTWDGLSSKIKGLSAICNKHGVKSVINCTKAIIKIYCATDV